jgi:hypothetical protein
LLQIARAGSWNSASIHGYSCPARQSNAGNQRHRFRRHRRRSQNSQEHCSFQINLFSVQKRTKEDFCRRPESAFTCLSRSRIGHDAVDTSSADSARFAVAPAERVDPDMLSGEAAGGAQQAASGGARDIVYVLGCAERQGHRCRGTARGGRWCLTIFLLWPLELPSRSTNEP